MRSALAGFVALAVLLNSVVPATAVGKLYPVQEISKGSGGENENGFSIQPSLSYDGKRIVFVSTSTNLLHEQQVGCPDPSGIMERCAQILLYDIGRGVASLVSKNETGRPGNGASSNPQLDEMDHVLFTSRATSFGESNDKEATIWLAAIGSGQLQAINQPKPNLPSNAFNCRAFCGPPSISRTGARIVFTSWDSRLVANDTNNKPDVFMRDETGIRIVSTGHGTTRPANDASYNNGNARVVSNDGNRIVFTSAASNLTEPQIPACPTSTKQWPLPVSSCPEIYLWQGGRTRIISTDQYGKPGNGFSWIPTISGDGKFVAFGSTAQNILASDDPRGISQVVLVSVEGKADQRIITKNRITDDLGNAETMELDIDSAGSRVAFTSLATNLDDPATNGQANGYVYDAESSSAFLLTRNNQGLQTDGEVHSISISGDGKWLAYSSNQALEGKTKKTSYSIYLVNIDEALAFLTAQDSAQAVSFFSPSLVIFVLLLCAQAALGKRAPSCREYSAPPRGSI